MKRVSVLAVSAIILLIAVSVILLLHHSGKQPIPSTDTFSTADIQKQDGIIPAYRLTVAVATNDSKKVVSVTAVVSGNLSRQGLQMLTSDLYVNAHNQHLTANEIAVYLYLSEGDASKGTESAVASYRREGNSRPCFILDDARFNALGIPTNAPSLLSERQRQDVFRMLHTTETRPATSASTQNETALMTRYGLTSADIASIREEGNKKGWTNRRESEK
jgi:hypothetical protein